MKAFCPAVLVALSACASPAARPVASAPPPPAPTPTVTLHAAKIDYVRRHLADGEIVELPVRFTQSGDTSVSVLEAPGIRVDTVAEGVCGRPLADICKTYQGCDYDRIEQGKRHVSRVRLGKTEAVYSLEVVFDDTPENAATVAHLLETWTLPGVDGGYACQWANP